MNDMVDNFPMEPSSLADGTLISISSPSLIHDFPAFRKPFSNKTESMSESTAYMRLISAP